MNGIILPIAITLVVHITTRQLDDPATIRVVRTSLIVDTGCDWSVEWLDCAASGVTAVLTDLLRLWLLPTGDLHKPLSLCRRHHRVLAQTSLVSLADDVCFFVNASQAPLGYPCQYLRFLTPHTITSDPDCVSSL